MSSIEKTITSPMRVTRLASPRGGAGSTRRGLSHAAVPVAHRAQNADRVHRGVRVNEGAGSPGAQVDKGPGLATHFQTKTPADAAAEV